MELTKLLLCIFLVLVKVLCLYFYSKAAIIYSNDLLGETVGVCYVENPSEVLPAELCVTMNQTIELVNFGAGGWSLLVGK